MYKLHFASWLHTMHLFATFMRKKLKELVNRDFRKSALVCASYFFPGIVLNFLKQVFHCVFVCILRCSCRKRQNVVHEVLFFMCCFSLCRNIKWPPLIFSYSLRTKLQAPVVHVKVNIWRLFVECLLFRDQIPCIQGVCCIIFLRDPFHLHFELIITTVNL